MPETAKFAWKIFSILIFGFIILSIAAWFIITSYWQLSHSRLSAELMSRNILKMINLAKILPPEHVIDFIPLIRHPGIFVTINQNAQAGFTQLLNPDLETIHTEILKNPHHVTISIPINGHFYLHFRTQIVRSFIFKLEFLAAIIVWFSALIIFCYLIVYQLSSPLTMFVYGVQRFSKDINAPSIPEVGPKNTRAALHAFNLMQNNLRQLIQNRTQMLAAISHDLKTPLTRLQLRIENFAASETTEKMLQDLKQMQNMIDSILGFAQHDVYREIFTRVNLDALLQTISDDMQDTGNPVYYEEFNGQAVIMGRPLELRRAIENIINNGVKYGKQVNIKLTMQPEQAIIAIIDQGAGIPEIEMEKVFLPFYRLDKSRSSETGGSGLGLATAKDIIQTHGGEIKLKNLVPHGLQVSIILPNAR